MDFWESRKEVVNEEVMVRELKTIDVFSIFSLTAFIFTLFNSDNSYSLEYNGFFENNVISVQEEVTNKEFQKVNHEISKEMEKRGYKEITEEDFLENFGGKDLHGIFQNQPGRFYKKIFENERLKVLKEIYMKNDGKFVTSEECSVYFKFGDDYINFHRTMKVFPLSLIDKNINIIELPYTSLVFLYIKNDYGLVNNFKYIMRGVFVETTITYDDGRTYVGKKPFTEQAHYSIQGKYITYTFPFFNYFQLVDLIIGNYDITMKITLNYKERLENGGVSPTKIIEREYKFPKLNEEEKEAIYKCFDLVSDKEARKEFKENKQKEKNDVIRNLKNYFSNQEDLEKETDKEEYIFLKDSKKYIDIRYLIKNVNVGIVGKNKKYVILNYGDNIYNILIFVRKDEEKMMSNFLNFSCVNIREHEINENNKTLLMRCSSESKETLVLALKRNELTYYFVYYGDDENSYINDIVKIFDLMKNN